MDAQEKWREVYTADSLKRLQQLELIELKVIKQICDYLNIQFVLYGGTLLGAKKYKGFIPWDDDVDIAMERDNYELFIKEAPSLLPKDFVIQNLYTDSKSPYSYTKLRLKGTRCIEKYNHSLNIEQGVYIDIYPIDDIPDDNTEYSKQFLKLQKLFNTIYTRQCLHIDKKEYFTLRGVKILFDYLLHRAIPISLLIKKQKKEMTKYNGRGYKRKTCWHYPKSGNYYDNYYPLQKVVFEGEDYYAPCDTLEHLKRRYGDINKLPPIEKRLGHEVYKLDFGKFEKKDPVW